MTGLFDTRWRGSACQTTRSFNTPKIPLQFATSAGFHSITPVEGATSAIPQTQTQLFQKLRGQADARFHLGLYGTCELLRTVTEFFVMAQVLRV